MTDLPFMPMYWPKFFQATAFKLTFEQKGCYALLLGHAWGNDGVLPDDDQRIANTLGISPRKWAALKAPIMAFWYKDENGNWSQEKMRREYDRARQKVETNRINGGKGGRPEKNPKRPEVEDMLPHMSARNDVEVAGQMEKKHNDFNETAKANGFYSINHSDNHLRVKTLEKESSSSKDARAIEPPAEPDERDDDDFLIKKLVKALSPTVPELVVRNGIGAVRSLLAEGCDLDADILPEYAEISGALKAPIRTLDSPKWDDRVRVRRDLRLNAPLVEPAPPPEKYEFVRADSPIWGACCALSGHKKNFASPTRDKDGQFLGDGWSFKVSIIVAAKSPPLPLPRPAAPNHGALH